jgi:hypothetical protein
MRRRSEDWVAFFAQKVRRVTLNKVVTSNQIHIFLELHHLASTPFDSFSVVPEHISRGIGFFVVASGPPQPTSCSSSWARSPRWPGTLGNKLHWPIVIMLCDAFTVQSGSGQCELTAAATVRLVQLSSTGRVCTRSLHQVHKSKRIIRRSCRFHFRNYSVDLGYVSYLEL